MDKIERIRAVIEGRIPDRVPYAFWSHFPEVDRDPELLTRTTVQFVSDYNVDLVKVMSNGMYAVEDFGCACDFSDVSRGGVAKITQTLIRSPDDWMKIEPLSLDSPALRRELRTLELMLNELGGKLPILFTVFSPLTIAEKLSCGALRGHLDAGAGQAIHHALSAMAETVRQLSAKAIDMGADGVFFANQAGTRLRFSPGEHLEYGVRYDMEALKGASKGWCNAIHLHGENIFFDDFLDYPVQILNWHVWETAPGIDKALQKTTKCLMGGIKRFSITENKKDELSAQIWASLAQSGGIRHILTPGCVVRLPVPPDALKHIEDTITEASRRLLTTSARQTAEV